MIIDRPSRPNGLYFIFNSRTKWDRECAEEKGGSPVFADWAFAKRTLGGAWHGVTRIALYDYAEDASEQDLSIKRRELRKLLKAEKPKLTVLVPPRAARSRDREGQQAENKGLKGHQAWVVAKAPARLEDMRGCIFQAPWGPSMGILNPINVDFAACGLVHRHMLGALAFATGGAQILRPDPAYIEWMPTDKARTLLGQILRAAKDGRPVAVDIENVPSTKQITAIAVAAGPFAVSVPWDEFKVAKPIAQHLADMKAVLEGRPIEPYFRMEPAGPEDLKALVREILATACPKVTHNGRGHDVPFLARKGFVMNGFVHDTIAACAAITNQWPKGLQQAVSAEFLVPPWKSEHHAKEYDIDSDEAWTASPPHLRNYNALDAWYDLRLFETQMYNMGAYLAI